jgi:tRNA pseudouridine38-40 synthase
MRVAVKFAYNGINFKGYARQPHLITVEGEIIKTLVKHGFIEDTSKSFFRSASRTDKGVSALANIIAFNTDSTKQNILTALSNEKNSIFYYGIKQVNTDFNPRHARLRHYRYFFIFDDHDIDKIIETANAFVGEHNFSNFSRLEPFKQPTRCIENIIFTEEKEMLIIDFYAQTFLWHQIRRIISALDKIGKMKIEKQDIVEALCNPERDYDFDLAPAEPLILKDIIYDFEFECLSKQLKKLNDLENKIKSFTLS